MSPRVNYRGATVVSERPGSPLLARGRGFVVPHPRLGTFREWREPPLSYGCGATCGCATTRRCERRSTRADRVVPVFCFDDRLLHGRHASGPRTQFLIECLADLDRSLRELGVRPRDPPRRRRSASSPSCAARSAPTPSTSAADVSPFARRRGERARRAFADGRHRAPLASGPERDRRRRDRDRVRRAVLGLLPVPSQVARRAAARRARRAALDPAAAVEARQGPASRRSPRSGSSRR